MFPVWLRFKGGKGVATTLGVLWGLHWPVGADRLRVWLLLRRALPLLLAGRAAQRRDRRDRRLVSVPIAGPRVSPAGAAGVGAAPREHRPPAEGHRDQDRPAHSGLLAATRRPGDKGRTLMFARAAAVLIAALCLAVVSRIRATAAFRASPAPSSSRTFASSTARASTLSAPMNVLVRGNTIEKISKDPIPAADPRQHQSHRRRRAHADAGPDRRALAHDAGAADAGGAAHGRRRLPQPGGRRRGHGHADARVHHRSRRGRAGVRAQARHRRGHRRRSAHLPVRRHHHRSPAVTATSASRSKLPRVLGSAAVAHGADRRQP